MQNMISISETPVWFVVRARNTEAFLELTFYLLLSLSAILYHEW